MREIDLHGNVLKNDEVNVFVTTGVRFNGRSLTKGQVHRVPAWFARDLYLTHRGRPAPKVERTPEPDVESVQEPEPVQPEPTPVSDGGDEATQAPRFQQRRRRKR